MSLISLSGMLLIFTLGILLLNRSGLYDSIKNIVICSFALAGVLILRMAFFDYQTYDYRDFLQPWIQYFANYGGFAALAKPVGNYNVPYLYFLALFSYFPEPYWLHLIKLLSVTFEIILAQGVLRLVSLYTDCKARRLTAFFATLLLPTVVLNGSVWGQCDVMHTAFCVWGMYWALSDRPVTAMIAFTAAFAVKLQAIFLLPILAVLWFCGKIKIRHGFLFPLSYIIIVLPAVLMGRPFWDTVTLYANQTGSIGSGLNYNSSSLFAFFPWEDAVDVELLTTLGILAAFALMFFLLGWALWRRKQLCKENILTIALLLVIGIPFFLPHMHDRYFFLADIFSLVFAIVFPQFLAIPLLVQFASLLGYHAYLKMQYLMPMRYGAMALIACLILLTAYLSCQFAKDRTNPLAKGD